MMTTAKGCPDRNLHSNKSTIYFWNNGICPVIACNNASNSATALACSECIMTLPESTIRQLSDWWVELNTQNKGEPMATMLDDLTGASRNELITIAKAIGMSEDKIEGRLSGDIANLIRETRLSEIARTLPSYPMPSSHGMDSDVFGTHARELNRLFNHMHPDDAQKARDIVINIANNAISTTKKIEQNKLSSRAPIKVHVIQEPAVDEAYRFMCGLQLTDQPVAVQKEYLTVVRKLGDVLATAKGKKEKEYTYIDMVPLILVDNAGPTDDAGFDMRTPFSPYQAIPTESLKGGTSGATATVGVPIHIEKKR